MNSLYLDTNFLIYLSDKSSPFYLVCRRFIRYCNEENILITTSTETIQEIIHYTKNTNQLRQGLKVAKKALVMINDLLPINKSVIDLYLKYASVYKSSGSRDLIHLAVCLENKINKIVTFDKDFDKFQEIKVFTPSEAINIS